ncbi:hypothetical protein ABPG75_009156 [Micractinium tetrahymenae]
MEAQEAVAPVEEPQTNGMGEGKEPAAAGRSGEGAEAPPEEEEPWKKRLWFVRMPRPPEAGALKGLEQEVELHRTQFNLITEALNVKKVERDGAREATRAAREAYQQCRAMYDERAAPVKELQQQRADAVSSATKLRESFSDLLVKSEAELEEQLAALHFRINHESISLNEEKKVLATIKKLEQQRERVREYEASASLFAESRAKRSELQDALKEHEGDLKALRQEMDVQRQILDKLREHEKDIDREVEEVITERRRCREVMEQAYQRLNALKKEQWSKNNMFYSNRGFSRNIRKLVEEGKLEEARAACAEQMEEAHEQLKADSAFRAEYFALWETQRKQPVHADEVDAALPPPSGKGKKGKGAPKEEEAVDPAKKAEAAIAALLEQARTAARAKAAAAAAAELVAAPAAASEGDSEEAAPAAAARGPREIVGLEAEAAAEAARAAARAAAKPKAAAPARHVEPVVEPEDKFELPEVVRVKEGASSAQDKAAERERNRRAMEEATARKARKQQEKDRKRQRQEALAREAAAAAARAAEAAQAAAAAAAAVADDAAAAAAASDSDSADVSGEAGAVVAPAAAATLEQRKKGSAGAGGKKAARPPARRLAPAKQRGLVQQARKAAKEYSVLLVLGLVAVLMFAIVMLFWTASTVPQ